MKFLVLNGPNLNLLGIREPEIYGSETLETLKKSLSASAKRLGIDLEFYQSNCEGALIDKLQEAMGCCQGVILNAAAYTHTSVALRDAICAIPIPVVEVHISNVYSREEFRRFSYISSVCIGTISGFGFDSYELGLYALSRHLKKESLPD